MPDGGNAMQSMTYFGAAWASDLGEKMLFSVWMLWFVLLVSMSLFPCFIGLLKQTFVLPLATGCLVAGLGSFQFVTGTFIIQATSEIIDLHILRDAKAN